MQNQPSTPSVAALRTQVGMNALCQEQNIASDANLSLFFLATRVSNASPVGEGLRKTTQERSSLTSAMPCVKEIASPKLHVEASYGHTQRTDLRWEKKVICPRVRDAQACKEEKSRMDTNVRIQRIWSTTKCNAKLKRQTHFGLNFKLKLPPKTIQKTVPN